MENRIAKNRTSPKNENDYIKAYQKLNSKSNIPDNLDVAAVIAKDGTRGHGLLPEAINRGHDKEYHRVKNFIADSELKKSFKK
ncbi:MAG: hypothetical protein IJJ82_08570 [Clostridia bacterium]|nr:hypothetical protein [Clostridia bacterium]